ncbi:thiol reductant ABC exporter subunit CydC [Guptibacillus hwajinpoensis]|uniref:thiol reductant ABC exporter subunit CydC n=1 Tax=Guptibacillus hwajinpoensis TaxID=208199 RepID=UPI001CFE8474|nr:thiol reductant ABC exporter subunit CydC [Pseudalkalibacillus hwajinpoensis]WLR60961.1 thiol reductant ABC exporter subunit CydC [Pseudalkalibacillus hwajinpoensis]
MEKKGWILPYLKENAKLFSLVILLGLVTAFSAAFLMFTSGFLISKAATRPENLLLIYVPIVAVRTFGILRAVSRYSEKLLSHHIILKVLSHMRSRLYETIEPRVLKEGSSIKTGDLLGVMAEDIEYLQDVYLKTIFPSVIGIFLYAVAIGMLGTFSWVFAGLMAIYGFILVFLFPLVSLLVTRKNVAKLKSRRSSQYSMVTDGVVGIGDWVFSGHQKTFIENVEKDDAEIYREERRRSAFVSYRNFAAQCVVAIIVLSMLVWTGNQSMDGQISYTLIVAFVLILFPLTEAFLPLSDAVSELPGYEDSINRLKGLSLEKPSEEEYDEKSIWKKSHLRFDKVSYQTNQGQWILKNINLEIPQGTKLAILGPSGSGKTSLLKLMKGIYSPSEGSVSINGLETALSKGNKQQLSVLNQQPYLFDTSVLNNLRLGKPSATDEEVYEAAKSVQLHDFIVALPKGYQTSMEEAGTRFSGGERQRIALARILLQAAPIVLLDEPTVGLDPRTEQEILSTIFQVLEGKTVVWVTHHLVGMKRMDHILFMDEGEIVMEGKHDEMLVSSDRYRRLYELDTPFQLKKVNDEMKMIG